MNKKIATWVGTVILIIIAITAFYFVKKADDLAGTDQKQPEIQADTEAKKEPESKNNILPPLTTVEGTVENVTKEGVLTIKDKIGSRKIILPKNVYVYTMVKNVPQTKGVTDIKKDASVVVQLKPDTETQEATSVFVK